MAIQWQDPNADEEPMTQEPGPTPAFIAHLSHLGRGALDLWMWLYFNGSDFHGTEAEIAKEMGRSSRWVTYASRLLREHGLLRREGSGWNVCSGTNVLDGTNVRSIQNKRAGTNVLPQHKRAVSDGTNVLDLQHKRAESQTLPPHTPLSRNDERENNNAPSVSPPSPAFEDFYRRYPDHRRTNRNLALTAWVQGGCDQLAEAIGDGLDRWLGSEDWADEDGKFVPSAHKFLAEQRWQVKPRKPKPVPSPTSRWVQREDGRWVDRDNPYVFKPEL